MAQYESKKHQSVNFIFYFFFRQHNRLVKNLSVNMEEYNKEKERIGNDAFYGKDNTIAIGLHKDTKDDIDNMVTDLEKQ